MADPSLTRRPPARIFCAAVADLGFRDALLRHLAPLIKQGDAVIWHEGLVQAGQVLVEETNRHLDAADLVLLLLSADFLASRDVEELANLIKYIADAGPDIAKITLIGINPVGDSLVRELPDVTGRFDVIYVG